MAFNIDKLKQFVQKAIGQGHSKDSIRNYIRQKAVMANRAGVTSPLPSGQDVTSPLPSGYTSPTPTPSATPTPLPGEGSYQMKLIEKYFPKEEWRRAWNVMQGESSGKADAVGDDYPIAGVHAPSYGLFQIRSLPGRPNSDQLIDPEFNVKYAADMFKNEGWGPWSIGRKLNYAK